MDSQKEIILIVDDEPLILKILEENLSSQYTIIQAENGKDALKKIADNIGIRCVLTDISMPQMDGVTLLKKLRQPDGHCSLPVIFFTGYGDDQNQLEAVQYGAFGFIAKPYFENLETLVKQAIEHGTTQLPKSPEDVDDYLIKIIPN